MCDHEQYILPENSKTDITKVKWLDSPEEFNRTSKWMMWWVLLHAVREILNRVRKG